MSQLYRIVKEEHGGIVETVERIIEANGLSSKGLSSLTVGKGYQTVVHGVYDNPDDREGVIKLRDLTSDFEAKGFEELVGSRRKVKPDSLNCDRRVYEKEGLKFQLYFSKVTMRR